MAVDHWAELARLWSLLGSPLRPVAEDVAVAESIAAAWRLAHPDAPLQALLLGVTQELAAMRWPAGTSLVAVDRSAAMIGALFPRQNSPPGSVARVGDWRALDLPDASVDLALGDGCFAVVRFPGETRTLVRELRRVVRPGGRVVLRVFVRPEMPESVGDVAAALLAGRVGSLHAFKWRLAMAVQSADRREVAVAEVWRAFVALGPGAPERVTQLAGSPGAFATFAAYERSPEAYAFPTLAELRSLLAEDFVEESSHVPGYELGDRCPTLVLAPRAR